LGKSGNAIRLRDIDDVLRHRDGFVKFSGFRQGGGQRAKFSPLGSSIGNPQIHADQIFSVIAPGHSNP
jgi:hypothetical protein